MPTKPMSTAQILALLAETPARLATLTADLSPGQPGAAPAPGEWSANEVLAHLRSCADMWGGCITAMLAEVHPTLRAVNPLTWIKQTTYLEQEFRPSLMAFTTQRAELLTVLEPLPPEGWERAATVTGAGKPLQRTVLFYAQWLASHERPHVTQVARIVAAALPEERVGRSA